MYQPEVNPQLQRLLLIQQALSLKTEARETKGPNEYQQYRTSGTQRGRLTSSMRQRRDRV